MTNEQFEAIKNRRAGLNIGGKGQWRADFDDGEMVIWYHARLDLDPRPIVLYEVPGSDNEIRCAEFIVNAPQDVQALIDEVGKLRQERDAARAEANRLKFYEGALLIAETGLETISEKSTEQAIKDMVGRTFDIIRAGK